MFQEHLHYNKEMDFLIEELVTPAIAAKSITRINRVI